MTHENQLVQCTGPCKRMLRPAKSKAEDYPKGTPAVAAKQMCWDDYRISRGERLVPKNRYQDRSNLVEDVKELMLLNAPWQEFAERLNFKEWHNVLNALRNGRGKNHHLADLLIEYRKKQGGYDRVRGYGRHR